MGRDTAKLIPPRSTSVRDRPLDRIVDIASNMPTRTEAIQASMRRTGLWSLARVKAEDRTEDDAQHIAGKYAFLDLVGARSCCQSS